MAENPQSVPQSFALAFSGPYSWLRDSDIPCVFDSPDAGEPGIYLWSIATDAGDLVHYVGETGRSMKTRLDEHLKEQLCGMYPIHDPSGFARGTKRRIWKGMYGHDREANIESFAARLPELAVDLTKYIRMIRFFLAPFEGNDKLRRRIEAALADHFYAQGGLVAAFQDKDIHYDRTAVIEEPFTVEIDWGQAIVQGARRELPIPRGSSDMT